MASVKTAPGSYTLDVSPQYRVVRITEARDEGVLVNAITVARRAAVTTRGFLHEITIEANDIAKMGLSGVGAACGCDGRRRDHGHSDQRPQGRSARLPRRGAFRSALTPLLPRRIRCATW